GRWAWCSRTRTTRSWPTWWRRTWPSPRRTWGFPAGRSGSGWTTPWRRWAWASSPATRPICSPAARSSGSPLPACWLWSWNASCWMRPPLCWTRWA
ncbi:DNA-binding transcriptional repressor PuuR, partial [Dysosmobacter welbionis]